MIFRDFLTATFFVFLPSCPYDRGLVTWVDDEPALFASFPSDPSSPGVGHGRRKQDGEGFGSPAISLRY